MVEVQSRHIADQEARFTGLGSGHEDSDHREQHHQATGQREQQEFQGRPATLGPAPALHEEIHRDEGCLEKDVKHQHIGRHEHEQSEALQHQGQGTEGAGLPSGRGVRCGILLAEPPFGQQHGRHQDHGQQHHGTSHAVQTEGVVGADLVDPDQIAGQLLGAGQEEDDQTERQRDQCRTESHIFAYPVLHRETGHGTDQRRHSQGGEQGDRVVHLNSSPQPNRPRTVTVQTRTTPQTIARP